MAQNEDGPREDAPGKRMLTAAEAAEYLGVSVPTIWRWAKQRLISYYKVGGATRFDQEGLDAVVEKTTGSKEAEAAGGRCAACGHSGLVDGRLRGFGLIEFQPDKTKFWTMHQSTVPTSAHACPACGHLQIHVDTAKLARLRRDPNEEEPAEDVQ